MVIVNQKKELRKALEDKEIEIVIKGKLAKRVSILKKFKKNKKCKGLCEDIGKMRAVATMGTLGVPTVATITLIITVGIVSVVAILKNYSIKVKKGAGLDIEVTLDKE